MALNSMVPTMDSSRIEESIIAITTSGRLKYYYGGKGEER